ncbi:hypothetical protein B0H13DRAFT_2365215 [Mycena leptocephala]|nr:hypothetical protein B0H13DRAFT_2365215 [Mycena leptocephala]
MLAHPTWYAWIWQTLDSRYYPGPVMCFNILLPQPDLALTCDTSNGDRCILDDRATSWEPSIIVEGAWVRMIPSPVALLDSHHYLEPPAARSRRIPSCSCVFHGAGAFRTTHMKLTTLLASISTLKSRSPPKFHSSGVPLDAEALHGASGYLPAVATDATTAIPTAF